MSSECINGFRLRMLLFESKDFPAASASISFKKHSRCAILTRQIFALRISTSVSGPTCRPSLGLKQLTLKRLHHAINLSSLSRSEKSSNENNLLDSRMEACEHDLAFTSGNCIAAAFEPALAGHSCSSCKS